MDNEILVEDYFEMYASNSNQKPLVTRSMNAIGRTSPQIKTMGELLNTSISELFRIRNLGEKTIDIILRIREEYANEMGLPIPEGIIKHEEERKASDRIAALSEALRVINSAIKKYEKKLTIIRDGTPEYTVIIKRIESFRIATESIDYERKMLQEYVSETTKPPSL